MIQLNLGCGTDIRDGFINIDVRALDGVNVVSSLESLPFENNYADRIVAQDVLEHFCRIELIEVVKEIKRVLKDGGILEIRVPDCEQILNKYALKELDVDSALGYIFGGQDYVQNVHKIGFTKSNCRYLLELFGFTVLEVYTCDATNLRCVAKK
jgi:ubiquinone/menaquinone biosynthesis C-methylase UbiE